jgi:hypothetical protein
LKKLASWDSPPTDAEMKEVAPLLDRIQTLKGGRGGALSGLQLMAFLYNIGFNPCNIVFPSFGVTLAWWILLESLKS